MFAIPMNAMGSLLTRPMAMLGASKKMVPYWTFCLCVRGGSLGIESITVMFCVRTGEVWIEITVIRYRHNRELMLQGACRSSYVSL